MNIKDIPWHAYPDAEGYRKSAAMAILRVIEWSDIHEKQKSRIINRVLLWDLTEGAEQPAKGLRGKYLQVDPKHNLRYWSLQAITNYDVVTGENKNQLRHEHVLSRKQMLGFLQNSKLSKKQKIELLTKAENVPACIVTIEENNKLNQVKSVKGWERYGVLSIDVYDRKEKGIADVEHLQRQIDPELLKVY
ncbi:MAG: hypothetical protein ACXAB7_14250 [Candidatus Kariarchaeaceae archaeon]|jgi:hypothetical protein